MFYSAIFLCAYFIGRIASAKSKNIKLRKHLSYSIIAIGVFVLFLDLGLRLLTNKYRSYSELNYGIFYITPFTDDFSIVKHKYFYGDYDYRLLTHQANSEFEFVTQDFSYLHTYNEYGLRERKKLDSLCANKTVVLTLGDSFTEGVGTNQDSTWQALLERKLIDSLHRDIIVVNAGISGADPVSELELFYQLQENLQPDLCIINLGSDDLLDIMQKGGIERFDEENKCLIHSQPRGYYFYSWSFLFRAVSTVVYDYPELFMNKTEFDVELEIASGIMQDAVNEISKIQESNNKETLVFFFPTCNELEIKAYKYKPFEEIKSQVISNESIHVVDLLKFYIDNSNSFKIPPEFLYWQTDGHMTPIGYRIWSDVLFTEIYLNDIIPI